MSDTPRDRLLEIGQAITDARRVDWDAESSGGRDLGEIRSLRQLEALARAHRSIAASTPGGVPPVSGASSPSLFRWGPLEVLELVGRGSFGEVYRALDVRLGREVALKLRRERSTDAGADVQRFLDEAHSLARIRHPNVLVIHGADVHDGRVGFWTDFIRGKTLATRLKEEGPLGAEEATLIGLALCRALAAVHGAGFIHGDVKATNVMREDGGRILLMDFGASWRHVPGESPAEATSPFGTPLVLAPEILLSEAPRPASDLYSLGVLLYHLTTRRYPMEAESLIELKEKHATGQHTSLRDLRPDLPPEFIPVVERAISSSLSTRFSTAGEMERALLASMRSATETVDEGQTLRSLFDELGNLPEKMCRQIGREIARALARIHGSGHAHGQLSAESALVLRSGEVRLLPPLGASTSLPPASSREAEQRADLRSLGALLYEAATGRKLEAEDESERAAERVSADVTPFFERIIRWLLNEGEGGFPGTARDVVRALTDGERSAWWRMEARAMRRDRRAPVRRIRIARETAFHGRNVDLQRLLAVYARVREGNGQVVLLDGEAGIGKTRLVDELMRRLDLGGEDLNFLFGSYPPGGAATATGAFLTAYREHLGEERLEETLADYLAVAPVLVTPYVALLRGESGLGSSPLTKDSLQTAFVHVTRALAAERPTIVLIDDLHFAPEEGRSLFAALALAAPGHRILLIGGTRSGLSEEWVAGILRQEHSSRLALTRLTRQDLVHILNDALGSQRLAEDLAPAMARRCDGNPLFLFENLRALEESGRMARDADGTWKVSGTWHDLPAPPSIQHLIQARFAGLAEEDKSLLEVACCSGFEFDPVLVAEATGVSVLAALKRFALIERRHRLIHATERHYVFDHHQVQEVLYAGLMVPLRERYHVALAETLEALEQVRAQDPNDVDGSVAVRLCEHYFQGGRGRDGLRYLRRSLNHLGSLRPAGSVELIDHALAVTGLIPASERFELLGQKVGFLRLLGNPSEEEASLREMLRLADESGQPSARAKARDMLAFFKNRMGQVDEARALLEEAEAFAVASGDTLQQAEVAQTRGSLALHRGLYDEALTFYARSRELARRADNLLLETRIIGSVGVAYLGLRRIDEAQRHCELHLELSRAAGHKSGETIATGNLGAVLLEAGRYDEALPLLERHLKLARESGIRLGEAYATGNLGALFVCLGRVAEGLFHLERSLRLSREIGYRIPEAESLERIGGALAMLGQFGEGRLYHDRSLTIAREIQNAKLEGQALIGLGAIAEQTEDVVLAESFYRGAEAAWNTIQATSDLAEVLLRLGGLFQRLGRDDEARTKLSAAVDGAREFGSARNEVLALTHLALLSGAGAGEAWERYVACEPRLSLAAKMEARFLLWKATGNRSHLAAASDLLATLRDHAPEEHREGLVARVAFYREIAAAAV